MDCEYFLGAGQHSEKHLWAGNRHAQIAKMRELYEMIPDKPEWLTPEMINSYEERMAPRYLVAAYHHFENGFDDKLDYYTLEEAEKAAQGYVDGTMEDDGFKYDGAAVYDQQEHKCIRIYGDYPDEKAHAQVRASAEPEQQEPEHFIDHFYVAEDIQKRGALDIKEYSSFDDALRAYRQAERAGKRERERGKEELPLKQKATVCTPQRVRIVAAFLLFDFGAFNHGQIFILLFFEKRLKIV